MKRSCFDQRFLDIGFSGCRPPRRVLMACVLLTVAEVFTAVSQSTAVCRDSVATNYVAGAPRTPLCAATATLARVGLLAPQHPTSPLPTPS